MWDCLQGFILDYWFSWKKQKKNYKITIKCVENHIISYESRQLLSSHFEVFLFSFLVVLFMKPLWRIGIRNTSYWSPDVVPRVLVSALLLSTINITVSAAPLTHSPWWTLQSFLWQNVEQYGVRLHKEHSANASRLQLEHWKKRMDVFLC